MAQRTFVITLINALVNLHQLVGATVQAKPFDDPALKHTTHIGVIDEVKLNAYGTWVRFQTDALVGKKWIKLDRVMGFAHAAESQTTAA